MIKKEMRVVLEELAEMFGENGCDHCPYIEQCQREQLYWGCAVWEEQMGEDL